MPIIATLLPRILVETSDSKARASEPCCRSLLRSPQTSDTVAAWHGGTQSSIISGLMHHSCFSNRMGKGTKRAKTESKLKCGYENANSRIESGISAVATVCQSQGGVCGVCILDECRCNLLGAAEYLGTSYLTEYCALPRTTVDIDVVPVGMDER